VKVVDASVLVQYLTRSDHREAAEVAIGQEHWLWVPALVDAEVGNALRRQLLRKEISPRIARRAFQELLELDLQRIPHDALAERAWQLRENVTYYDALYVALAEELGVPLLTLDQHLAGAPGLAGKVELIAPV
jgi:predicted nucleic acid-binding protein